MHQGRDRISAFQFGCIKEDEITPWVGEVCPACTHTPGGPRMSTTDRFHEASVNTAELLVTSASGDAEYSSSSCGYSRSISLATDAIRRCFLASAILQSEYHSTYALSNMKPWHGHQNCGLRSADVLSWAGKSRCERARTAQSRRAEI